MPKVTVLMPVYNNELYVYEAVSSILNQTFGDFELLIVDDGSTDASASVIEAFQDPRIRLVRSEMNEGLVAALNKGLALAEGEYIARMDSDDIALPERLEKQVALLDQRADIGLCGTQLKLMNADIWFSHPTEPEQIRCKLLFNCCINHPTVMFRRELMLANGLWYDAFAKHAEDYELWTRMAQLMRLANLDEPLLLYRMHEEQVTSRYAAENQETADRVLYRQMVAFGIEPTPEQFLVHLLLSRHRLAASPELASSALSWLDLLQAHNRSCLYYEVLPFEEMLQPYREEAMQLCRINRAQALRLRRRARRTRTARSGKRRKDVKRRRTGKRSLSGTRNGRVGFGSAKRRRTIRAKGRLRE